MGLETGTRIPDLVATNPVGATDFVSQGDDHIRLIKAAVQGSFPNLGSGQVTADATELSILDGATLSVAELNLLDGVTATTAELNYTDGVTSNIQTQLDAKASTAAVAAGYQPLDSDLTAIAALTTTSFGRGFIDLADLAALATKIAALAPSWTQQHVFANAGGALTDYLGNRTTHLAIEATGGYAIYLKVAGTTGVEITSAGLVNVNDAGTLREVGYRQLPVSSNNGTGNLTLADTTRGKIGFYYGSGGHTLTLPSSGMTAGGLFTFWNEGSGSITISSSGAISWLNGSSVGSGSRTLAAGGIVSIYSYNNGANWYIWGTGLS